MLSLRHAGRWLMLLAALLVAAMPNGSALCLPWFGQLHLHVGLAMHADAPQDVYTVYWHPLASTEEHGYHEHHAPAPVQAAGVHDGPTFMPGAVPLTATLPAPLIPWGGALGAMVIGAVVWTRVYERDLHRRRMAWPPPTQPPRTRAV